ncbi:extracellular calcium-sensing receptor-like [Clytia hemisphaerica]|uniref:G-protein coupled receptors family 3 profile domain-containing protein n=1 Tax=Clytia hemisphaerica TaxID=252671 RepID=A0A7M5UV04_9CNID
MTVITNIKSCFDYIKLSSSPSTNDQNVVNDFWFNNRKNVVLLFGSKANINNLFQTLTNDTISKITWVGHSAWTNSLKLNNTKYKKNIERLVKPVLTSYHFLFTEKLRNSYFDSQQELGLMQNILNALDIITQTLVQVVNQTANLKTSENTPKPSENTPIVVTRRLVIERFQAFQNNTNHLVRFNSSTNQNGIIAFPNSNTSDNLNLLTSGNYTIKCAQKECGFDYKSSYGNLSTNTPRQTKTYKYFCIKCENNDVSPSCRRQYEHIQYYSTSAYVIYTIVTLGVLSGVTICVIFYRFRKTPYVKASHQNMSLVQLFAHLLLFLAPLMFFGTPSEALCTARPIAFGILFTFIMAMTLTKTQKLNFIFQARIRVSKRQIQMSQKMEVSLILLMMFVQMCIAGLSYLMSSSRVLVVAHQGTKESNYTIKCNTDEEFFIQLLFGFLLSLMCMIQAFKARNLPENFNETKLIFITMFLCDVAVCVWFAIRFTSSESSTRVHADVLLLLSMNFILLITMYGHKCWIIIFHPELNTTSAFKENIKQHNLREMVPSHVTMNHRDSTFSGITSISTPPDLRSTIVRHSMDNLSYTHN